LDSARAELHWKKLDKVVEEYIEHPESKFENGHRSGTMRRKHVEGDLVAYIGKESNELEEAETLGIGDENYVIYVRN
jgi:hypothetical protein